MAYIGNIPAESYASFETETFSVSATANYTLSHAVTNENEIRLVINGVVQQPGSGKAYTASGTTLTLTSATVSGDSMYAVYLGRALQTVNPPNASVGSDQAAPTIITGQTAETSIATDDTILIHDTSASALRKMTRANFVSGIGGSNNIRWMASKISDQTLAYNTRTTIEFSNQVIDVGTCYNDSTYKFTVPSGEGGTYMIGAGGWVYDQQENAEKVDFIIVHTPSGGSANDSWFQSIDTGQSMDSQRIANHISGIQTLSAGDTLHCDIQVVTGDSGTSLFSGSGNAARFRNYFWGYKLIT